MNKHRYVMQWVLAGAVFLLLAGGLRFWMLDIRPLHHDEGANSHFMRQLIDHGSYHYNPRNYHGPLLYFLTWLPLRFTGLASSVFPAQADAPHGDIAFRFMPALLGMLLIFLVPALRRWLGRAGTVAAMLLVAVSPIMVYYSRDNIHEIYLLFFTLAAFVSGYRFYCTRAARWMYGLAAALAGMFAIKETAVLTLAVWAGALVMVLLWQCRQTHRRLSDMRGVFMSRTRRLLLEGMSPAWLILVIGLGGLWAWNPAKVSGLWWASLLVKGGALSALVLWLSGAVSVLRNRQLHLGLALGLFFLTISLLFTNFFTWSGGIPAFFNAFELWFSTGTEHSQHNKYFAYYLVLLVQYESPVVLLGTAGLWFHRRKQRTVTFFVSLWALGLFLIYSMIPYKTPWLVLNMVVPWALLAGCFMQALSCSLRSRWSRRLLWLVFAMLIIRSAATAVRISFVDYDDDREKIIYVQTRRAVKHLVRRVWTLSDQYDGLNTRMVSVTPEYWPLPWYFRDFPDMLWFGRMIDHPDAPVILARNDQAAEIERKLPYAWRKEEFALRPGVTLILYYKADGRANAAPVPHSFQATEPPRELAPGLIGEVYGNAGFTGRILDRRVSRKIDYQWADDTRKPWPAPFSIVWKGWLYAPQTGGYILITESDDGSWLLLHDQVIVDNGGDHAAQRKSGAVQLEAGYHPLTLKYYDRYYGAVIRLLGQAPGQPVRLLRSDVLFHKPVDAVDPR